MSDEKPRFSPTIRVGARSYRLSVKFVDTSAVDVAKIDLYSDDVANVSFSYDGCDDDLIRMSLIYVEGANDAVQTCKDALSYFDGLVRWCDSHGVGLIDYAVMYLKHFRLSHENAAHVVARSVCDEIVSKSISNPRRTIEDDLVFIFNP